MGIIEMEFSIRQGGEFFFFFSIKIGFARCIYMYGELKVDELTKLSVIRIILPVNSNR